MPAMPAPMTHTSVSKLSLSGWPIGGWAMALHTDWCFISRSSSGAQMGHHQAPQNACRGAGGAYGSGEARAAIEVQDLSGEVVILHGKDDRLGGMLRLPDATGQNRAANSLVVRFLIGAHMAVPAAAHNTETDGVDTDRPSSRANPRARPSTAASAVASITAPLAGGRLEKSPEVSVMEPPRIFGTAARAA